MSWLWIGMALTLVALSTAMMVDIYLRIRREDLPPQDNVRRENREEGEP